MRRAMAETLSVVGPGTASARSNDAASSRWQKYCEANSSGRQMMLAPAAAARSIMSYARRRFSPPSVPTIIWMSATLILVLVIKPCP